MAKTEEKRAKVDEYNYKGYHDAVAGPQSEAVKSQRSEESSAQYERILAEIEKLKEVAFGL